MATTTILSWNVNGYRAVAQKGFLDWLKAAGPDILCIQELRVHPGELEMALLEPCGYKAWWNPAKKKGYSGTATFSRRVPVSTGVMGIAEFDDEGRVQVVEYPEFTIVNAYFPNSQQERARLDYKLRFCKEITAFCDNLRSQGRNVVLCGDYNIAHTEIDLARPKDNDDSPGYYPEERAAMTEFLGAGYCDTFRHFVKEGGHYSWWSYRGGARQRNVGWRIDYHCVNEEFLPRVKRAWILPDVMGSDHCPVGIEVG